MKRKFRESFKDNSSGAALIEFALVLPVLLTLLVGTIEMSRFAIIELKLDKAANAMTDFVTQGSSVKATDLAGYAGTMPQIMKPFSFSGTVIFSSLVTVQSAASATPSCANNVQNCITWQNRPVGTDASALGGLGASVTLPGNYKLEKGQDMIAAEVYYNYAPLLPVTGSLISALAPQKLYKLSVTKPRLGALTTLQ